MEAVKNYIKRKTSKRKSEAESEVDVKDQRIENFRTHDKKNNDNNKGRIKECALYGKNSENTRKTKKCLAGTVRAISGGHSLSWTVTTMYKRQGHAASHS